MSLHRPTVTIFGTPKAFEGMFDRIQRNAIGSWARLGEQTEVLVIGSDPGTAELVDALGTQFPGVRHLPNVRTSDRGVPLVSDLFAIAQRESTTEVCLFSNADLILQPDIIGACDAVASQIDGRFLLIGQRTDIHLHDYLEFEPGWADRLTAVARTEGELNSPIWIDWFAFRRNALFPLRDFVIGRPGYDHWLVARALEEGLAVVDATDAVLVIHQHHDYSSGGGRQAVWHGPEAQSNKDLIGGRRHMRIISNASHRLTPELRVERARGTKYLAGRLHAQLGPLWEASMGPRHKLGLDADRLQRAMSKISR